MDVDVAAELAAHLLGAGQHRGVQAADELAVLAQHQEAAVEQPRMTRIGGVDRGVAGVGVTPQQLAQVHPIGR